MIQGTILIKKVKINNVFHFFFYTFSIGVKASITFPMIRVFSSLGRRISGNSRLPSKSISSFKETSLI